MLKIHNLPLLNFLSNDQRFPSSLEKIIITQFKSLLGKEYAP